VQTGDAVAALFRARPLPKVASLVVTACEVALRGPAGSLCVTLPCGTSQSGAQYSERLIQATLSPHWPPRQAAGIAACLAGGPLTPALGDALAAKVSSALRTAATQDWPSMCHHAWAAAASGGGDVGLALNRCVTTLEGLSEPQMNGAAAQSARCNAQGVVLMTLERDASQPRLGEAFARACSTGTLCQSQSSLGGQTTMPGPFRCAVVLALARATHALEEAALLALHEAVLKSFSHGGGGRRADGSVHSPSPWLTSLAVQQGAAASGGQVGQHPLLEVVACTTIGWDLIVPSLVALSLRMLDTLPTSTATDAYDPLVDALAAVAAMDATGSEGDVATNSLFTPHAQTAALGVHLLLATFKHHDSARRTIIRACATQLAGATTSSGGGGGGSRARATSACGLTPSGAVHARLLVSLCRAYPAAVAPHGECLRDAFHHAACLSPEVTSALLLCIRPLHALAPQLQEHCALALRKALFDTAPGRAGAAARGVLHQALQATIAAASGRNPGVGDDGAGPSQDRPAVSLQLGGFLRRCLTQDAAVRRCAYRGLAGLAEADPHGHGAATAASTLLSQLSRYVSHTPGGGAGTQGGGTATRRDSIEDADVDDDDDGIQPAFQLAACVTQPAQGDAAAGGAAAAAVVVEPFASLLRACWDVTAAVAAAGEGPHAVSASVVNQLRECTWKTLHKLLSTCEDSVAWEEAYGVAGAVTGGAADGAATGPQAYDATSAARAQVLCASLQVAVDWAMHELLASRLKLTPAWREALGRAMACHTRMRLRMAAAARAANKKGAAGAPAPDADDATAADGGGGTAAPAAGTLARSGRGGIGASMGASRGGQRSEVGMRGASLVALLNAMMDPNDLAGVLPRDKEKGAAGFPGAPVVNTATSTQFVVHAAAEALHAGSDSTWLLSLAAGHVDDMAVVRALAPSCSMVAATVGHARPDTSGRSIAAALLRVLAQLVMSTVRGGGAAGAGAEVTPSKGQPKGKSSGGGTGKPGRQAVLVDPPMRVVLTAVEAYLRRCASRGGLDGMRDAAAALSTAFSTTRCVSMEPESSSSDDDEDDAMPVAQAMGKQKQGRGGQLLPAMSNTDLAAGLKAGVLKLQILITNAVGVKAMAKDTACLLACVGHITTMYARATNRPCTDTANWALKTITTQAVIADATSAQALAWLAVQLRTPPADANGAQVICEALRSAHGCDQMDADGVSPDDDDDEDGAAKKWASVKQSLTAGAMAVGVLRWADGVLSDVEWLMTVLKAHVKAMEHLGVGLRGGGDGEEEEEGDEEDAAQRTGLRASALAAVKHRRALEDAVCGRLTELVPVVASIMGCVVFASVHVCMCASHSDPAGALLQHPPAPAVLRRRSEVQHPGDEGGDHHRAAFHPQHQERAQDSQGG
jgi:hypothetical protein